MNKKTFDLGALSTYRNQIYGLTTIWIMLLHGSILDKIVVPKHLNIPYFVISHGNVGVDIFLFLAGMGMYYSFTKNSDIREYSIKRLVRILVPYFIFAGIYFIYSDLYVLGNVKRFFLEITQASFWFKGNHIVWYIPGIITCYMIYPYLYAFLYGNGKNVGVSRLIVAVVGWMLFTYGLKETCGAGYNNIEILLTRIPIFVIGCAFAKEIYDKKKISILWMIPSVVTSVGTLYVIKHVKMELIQQRYLYMVWALGLVFTFAFLFSIVRIKIVDKILIWFGGYSLELYLLHILARAYFMKSPYYTGNVWYRWLFILMLCVAVIAIVGKPLDRLQKIILKHLIPLKKAE